MSTNKDSCGRISDEVIAVCAINATLKTEGVAGMEGGITDELSRNLLGRDSLTKGAKVSQDDDGITVDLDILVRYPVSIPAVAWDIQENVKNEIRAMTDLNVKAVNIHVKGVEIPSEDKKKDDKERSSRNTDADTI